MATYSEDFKNSVVRKLLPPNGMPIAEVSREVGVSEPTLLSWSVSSGIARSPPLRNRPRTVPAGASPGWRRCRRAKGRAAKSCRRIAQALTARTGPPRQRAGQIPWL